MRRALLLSTALLAPCVAQAQAPRDGRVVAGQAAISQSASRTQVTQSSERAVIEWRGFDVGAGHHVDIRQPGAASFSLQRVTGGDPSAIAGRVTSNGGVALVNPAGIVFHAGAQVDVASLIATTADTANTAFMAGRMAFDRPSARPDARVENRGSITVAQSGLAALVAPQVANSGVIRARMGRVALAGSEVFTLDLAGDGLVQLDVTRQMRGAALVTNSGEIIAEAGHVTLTARAASGVVESLVEAGGRIAAPGGSIEVNAPGGAVRVAQGASLAADAGRVAVGAGRESRVGAPQRLAARTTVERGATLRADRGTVIVHAERRTAMHGTARAEGGAIEVSSRGALALDGTMQAPGGTVLVDPQELRVVAALSGSLEPAEITAAAVNATTGALTLQAERTIRVQAPVNKPSGPLTLETTNPTAAPGEGILIERTLRVTGDLVLRSAGDITQLASGATLNVGTLEARSAGGAVRLDAGGNAIRALAGGAAATRFDIATTTALSVDGAVTASAMRITANQQMSLLAPLRATGMMELVGLRGINQAATGAGTSAGSLALESPLGAISLTGTGNRVVTLADVSAPFGLTLVNETGFNLAGTLSGGAVSLTALTGDLTQDPAASRLLASEAALFAPAGSVLFDGALNAVPRARGAARDEFRLDAGGALALSGTLGAATVDLRALGDITQEPGATVAADLLRLSANGGQVLLDDPGNAVRALGAAGTGGAVTLATTTPLAIEGVVTAPSVTLVAPAITQGAGRIDTALLRVNALAGDVTLGGANAIDALGDSGARGGFAIASTRALVVTGALDADGALLLEAPSLRLEGAIVAGGITLRALAGDAAQGGGRLAAAWLEAQAFGEARLEAAGNALPVIAGRAGTGFRVATSGAARLDGITAPEIAITAGGITQSAPLDTALLSLASTSGIDLRHAGNAIRALGRVRAPGGFAVVTGTALNLVNPLDAASVEISAGGDITQNGGATLAAGTLLLATTGSVTLEEAGNLIPRLLGARATGDLRLVTAGTLSIEGPVAAGGLLSLTAMGEVTQAAGAITATRLRARSVTGAVTLEAPGNLFDELDTSFAAARFALAHEGAAPLRLVGLVTAPELALTLARGMVAAGGALRADALRLLSAGAVRLDQAGSRVGALGGQAPGLVLASEGAVLVTDTLDVSGRLALSAESIGILAPVAAAGGALLIATSGDIAQAPTGAAFRVVGGVEAHAAGAVVLDGGGNQVPLLLGGSAAGGFAVASDAAMTMRGGISGETIALRGTAGLVLERAELTAGRAVLIAAPGGLSGGATTQLAPLDPTRRPVLIIDTRRAGGLAAIPPGVRADLPGLQPARQSTQLASFGAASAAQAGGAVFDIAAGASPVFLLLDAGAALGVVQAGRLGLLGQGGSAFLVGTLGGTGGEGAAALVSVAASAPGYIFNQCQMGLASCGAPPPAAPPPVVEAPGVAPPPRPAPLLAEPLRFTEAALLGAVPEAVSWLRWAQPWPLPPMLREER